MTEAVAPAPREQGWKPVLLALAAFLLLPMMPVLRAIVPIVQPAQLLVPALAVCTLIGWAAGGRGALVLIWTALTVWILLQAPNGGDAMYRDLSRGWALFTAAAFGLVCVFGTGRSFLSRGLVAVALALMLGVVLIGIGVIDPVNGVRAVAEEHAVRNTQVLYAWERMIAQFAPEWDWLESIVPAAGALSRDPEGALRLMSSLALLVFPALLALESLAALALAWALYHRLSRARIGAPLAPLRDFRFNDQLVWGLIVGFAVVFLPTLAGLRGAGLNLLVFFGALYALRGLGIIAFFATPLGGLATTLAFIFAMLVWPIFAVLAALALGLGLGDTWLDWRRRTRPTT